ncbi:MAG: tetraacyldisaccharide 4'-kinase [Algoriphagus sp.]|uniref:tetraacyldisaccharide 4'-kinase n=1 Tax=Algoriphagus sp. TaxID=1872435 RepID=UPI0026259E41|nr:tetraacyldisaccharide 4'-kinase [Algoriphagus sp.]MDG1279091.1 tetraacyldisaccharide 4'-kinase [Algoriphagus sp.]
MRWYDFLLYPFALLYDLVTSLRNIFFDLGWKKSQKSKIPSIVVGNLSVGGTGKTPMVEFLIAKLKSDFKVAVLSRGYGRKTKGFLTANSQATPSKIGDEPFQIFRKFKNEIEVFVGEDRLAAIEKISSREETPEVLILDDAFQHRYILGDFIIVLTTYQKPFCSDFLLPMGRLRESRKGAKRGDVVIVTKSPEILSDHDKSELLQKINRYIRPKTPVIFSSISYGVPFPLRGNPVFSPKIILLTGLADDGPLVEYVSQEFQLLTTLSYPDHYDYSLSDFEKIKSVFRSFLPVHPVILTTEKDAVKVKSNAPEGFLQEIPIFVLPIVVSMSLTDEAILDRLIQQKVFNRDQHK